MKFSFAKYAFAATFLCFALTATAQKSDKWDWAMFGRYANGNTAVKGAPHDTCRIVMMGNSITQLWAERHPDFFTSNHMIGRGISGNTSYQMLSRFRSDVIELKPEAVIILAGTNDVAEVTHPFNPDLTMGNIASMVELAKVHGIVPVLGTIPPGAVWDWMNLSDVAPDRIRLLNDRIRNYAAQQRITLVDYYPLMANPDGTFKDGMSYDKIHPTPEGYAVMQEILLPIIKKLLE